jgi:hypothetical protein
VSSDTTGPELPFITTSSCCCAARRSRHSRMAQHFCCLKRRSADKAAVSHASFQH